MRHQVIPAHARACTAAQTPDNILLRPTLVMFRTTCMGGGAKKRAWTMVGPGEQRGCCKELQVRCTAMQVCRHVGSRTTVRADGRVEPTLTSHLHLSPTTATGASRISVSGSGRSKDGSGIHGLSTDTIGIHASPGTRVRRPCVLLPFTLRCKTVADSDQCPQKVTGEGAPSIAGVPSTLQPRPHATSPPHYSQRRGIQT